MLELSTPQFPRFFRNLLPLTGWSLLVAGCAFALVAIGSAAYECFFLSNSTQTDAIVIALEESHTEADPQNNTPAQTLYCPEFRFADAAGVLHLVTSSACSNPASFGPGQNIQIRYLKTRPNLAQIDSLGQEWGLAIGFGAAGLVASPLGALILLYLRHKGTPVGFFALYDSWSARNPPKNPAS